MERDLLKSQRKCSRFTTLFVNKSRELRVNEMKIRIKKRFPTRERHGPGHSAHDTEKSSHTVCLRDLVHVGFHRLLLSFHSSRSRRDFDRKRKIYRLVT